MGSHSATQAQLYKTPSDIANRSDRIAQDLATLRNWFQNQAAGLHIHMPTTASTQAAGVGNTVWRFNVSEGFCIINGVTSGPFAAAADTVIWTGSLLTGFTLGRSAVAAIVVYLVGTTVTGLAVIGAAATTGTQLAPSDPVIQAAVDAASGVAGTAWIKLACTTLNRTADAVVTQSIDNGKRPIPTVGFEASFGNWT